MSVALSNDGQEVLQRGVAVDSSDGNVIDVIHDLQVQSVVNWIRQHPSEPRNIAVQMPDALLPHAAQLYHLLTERLNGEDAERIYRVYILADTTYASCCVDKVTAMHVKADAIIHYGDACLQDASTSSLPLVYYVRPRAYLNDMQLKHLRENIRQTVDEIVTSIKFKRLLLLYEWMYEDYIDLIEEDLYKGHGESTICVARAPSDNRETSANCLLGRRLDVDQMALNHASTALLFIGRAEAPLLALYQWCHPAIEHTVICDPRSETMQTTPHNAYAALRKRLYLVQRVRDARTIGIVCSTVSMASQVAVVDKLKTQSETTLQDLCIAAGKTYYTLSVGKLNVAKLANFAVDIDVFVNVSCPYGILTQQQTREHARPIVTVFEACVALQHSEDGDAWMANRAYSIDFEKMVLKARPMRRDEKLADVSLIDGRVREQGQGEQAQSQALLLHSAAGANFASRTWRGMDEGLGEVLAVAEVRAGRSGVAASYENEP